jgi:predicted nucleotidyltransferase
MAEIFQKRGVLAAYLFGSQKEAGSAYLDDQAVRVDEKSDLDIGIVAEEPPAHMYEYFGNLYADLAGLFEPFKLDIVFFHEVHALLKYDMICGHRIFSADERRTDDYEETVMKTAEDLAFKRRQFEQDFSEAITNGHFELKPR